MKLQHIAFNSLLYTLYMFASCVVVMLVESLVVGFVTDFVVLTYPVLTIVRVVIYTLGVSAIMACLGYFEGYREGTASVGETLIGGGVAILFHSVFAMLFHFQAFVTGGVRFAAGLVGHGMNLTADLLNRKTSILFFLLFFLLYDIAYIAFLAIARYFGAQKRIVDRADLRRDETPDAE